MEEELRLLMEAVEAFSLFSSKYLIPLIRAWWWLPLPFLLVEPAWENFMKWRQLKAFRERDYILMEFKLPEEIRKPMAAMEDVFVALYMIALEHSPSTPREEYIWGETTNLPTFSLELVGIDGQAHFYIYAEDYLKNSIKTIFHSQYPDLEIREVEDYVKRVPQDAPDGDWDLWCYDWTLKHNDAIPIKTHKDFETGKEAKEEKRVDPMARLLESFTHLRKGEQVWIQFVMTDAGNDWRDEGKKEVDKMAKRGGDDKEKREPLLLEAAKILLFGAKEEEEKEKKMFFPEMQMTPGERQMVEDMEHKMSKQGFNVNVRTMYIGNEDVFFKPHAGLPVSYLSSFGRGSQWLTPVGATRTKRGALFNPFNINNRVVFMRKRLQFRNYKWRVNCDFPKTDGFSALNPEELAALFHFPGREAASAPSLHRIKAKRGEAPPGLPVEEE